MNRRRRRKILQNCKTWAIFRPLPAEKPKPTFRASSLRRKKTIHNKARGPISPELSCEGLKISSSKFQRISKKSARLMIFLRGFRSTGDSSTETRRARKAAFCSSSRVRRFRAWLETRKLILRIVRSMKGRLYCWKDRLMEKNLIRCYRLCIMRNKKALKNMSGCSRWNWTFHLPLWKTILKMNNRKVE